MKKLKIILYAIIGLVAVSWTSFYACRQTSDKSVTVKAWDSEEKNTAIRSTKVQLASDIDPVCNMSVNDDFADTTLYNGKIYGFCSGMCKESFISSHRKATK